MPKNSSLIKPARVPPEAGGIQINFCKNPSCQNFGVPAQNRPYGHKKMVKGDGYTEASGSVGLPVLKCLHCGEFPPIKSNIGIYEEFSRALGHLQPALINGCPETSCVNHGVAVTVGKSHYQSFGSTHSGSKRYRCKACGRTFAIALKSTLRQRESHKNRLIFSLLVNKSPFRRICEVADIHPETLYQRIDFFYKQCTQFAASREAVLLNGMPIKRLYIAVDRQDYIVNWSNQDDKRNVVLHAIGSADQGTGYVFGTHLDFDPTLDPNLVERDAASIGDQQISYPFRRYARVWLKADYTDNVRQRRRASKHASRVGRGVINDVASTYDNVETRIDIESSDTQSFDTKLPAKGMQIHPEYCLYGHFFFLKKLLCGVEKIRFFLDQESGIRAACLGAFADDIKERRVDAFFVRINKRLTINERRRALSKGKASVDKERASHPGLTDNELELVLIENLLSGMSPLGKWNDRWLLHPFPNMSEPEKAVCHLTDYGDYDQKHLARLYKKASLHSIDRFFMQIRRRLSLLERPIHTSSASSRAWHGYSPYNPEIVVKLLTIFRVFYNYVAAGEDDRTPAMRLGLARAPIDIQDILYYHPARMELNTAV